MIDIKEKAIIEIEKGTVDEVMEEETKSMSSPVSSGGISGITDKLKSAATKMATNALNSIISDITGNFAKDTEQLEVQFNPAELKISASTKKSRPQTGIDVKHKKAQYGSLGVQVSVSIPLIFDVSDEKDGVIGNNISNKLKKGNDLAAKVDKFIETIKDPYLRNIRFSWGNLLYEGKLYSVDVNYTMFNRDGSPIRASVDLELLCRNEDGKSYWDERCQQMIGKEAGNGII